MIKDKTKNIIYELLYTKQSATKALTDLSREYISNGDLKDTGYLTLEQLTNSLGKESSGRLRFIDREYFDKFSYMPLKYRLNFSLYYHILSNEDRKLLDSVLDLINIKKSHSEEDMYMKLRTLSAIVKKSQNDTFTDRWKILVDLHLLRDFQENLGIEKFEYDVKRWATGNIRHTIDGSESKFLEYFKWGVRKFMNSAPNHSISSPVMGDFPYYTIEQFSEDPSLWARSGSSMGKRLKVKASKSGKLVNAKKSKWATALAMTKEEVKDSLLSWQKQDNIANEKREAGKVRAMVMGDISTYNKMTFVGLTVEHLLRGHPNCTLFMTPNQMTDLWTLMAKQTGSGDFVFIPIDQSEFDHNVSMAMINIMIDEIDEFIKSRVPPNMDELLLVNDRVRYALNGGTVRVGKTTFNIEKGVMSGWRFTALYDTMANAGEFFAFQRHLQEQGVSGVVGEPIFQGDDVRVCVRSYADAILLWREYSLSNFDVNPGKFFIRSDCDEYLREVAFRNSTCGYPARAIRSLVFRSPLTVEKIIGEEKLSEQLQNWTTVGQRLGYFSFFNLMVQDMSRGNKLSKDQVLQILITPTIYGGLGFNSIEYGSILAIPKTGLAIKKASFDRDWLPINEEGFSGTSSMSKRWLINNFELSKLYFNNIEYKGRGLMTRKFELETVVIDFKPIVGNTFHFSLGIKTFSPHFRRDIPDKVRELLTKDNPLLLAQYLTPDSKQVYDLLEKKASRRVVIAWLESKLPFSLPVSSAYSGLAVSVFGTQVIAFWWDWMLNRTTITWSTVIKVSIRIYRDVLVGLQSRETFEGIVLGT